jgi:hypothetical protein
MVNIKNKIEQNSTRGCPSQCLKGPTQVSKIEVLIPVKLQSWRCRCRCYSNRDSDDRFAWSYAREMTSSNERLRLEKGGKSWMKRFSR